ncbi:MAG: hypothetical protein WCL23_03555 [Candidatus Moraniibacteriota bacterium]
MLKTISYIVTALTGLTQYSRFAGLIPVPGYVFLVSLLVTIYLFRWDIFLFIRQAIPSHRYLAWLRHRVISFGQVSSELRTDSLYVACGDAEFMRQWLRETKKTNGR